jgi:hypothetical protein
MTSVNPLSCPCQSKCTVCTSILKPCKDILVCLVLVCIPHTDTVFFAPLPQTLPWSVRQRRSWNWTLKARHWSCDPTTRTQWPWLWRTGFTSLPQVRTILWLNRVPTGACICVGSSMLCIIPWFLSRIVLIVCLSSWKGRLASTIAILSMLPSNTICHMSASTEWSLKVHLLQHKALISSPRLSITCM